MITLDQATPAGAAADGYGEFVTVDKLEALEKQRIEDQLRNIRPELVSEGVRVLKAKIESDAAMKKLQLDVNMAVGGDGCRTAMKLFTDGAQKLIAAEAAAALEAQAKVAAAAKAPAKK